MHINVDNVKIGDNFDSNFELNSNWSINVFHVPDRAVMLITLQSQPIW